MLKSLIISLIITVFIVLFLENLRMNIELKAISYINTKIKNIISRFIEEKKYFDIFALNELRKKFDDEFLKTKILDKYELYKINDSTLKVTYKKGYVFEELEVIAENGVIRLKEIDNVEYSNGIDL